MIEKFLNAKHWQVLLIVVIIPYLLQISAMILTKNSFEQMSNISIPILLIFMLGFFGWFWSIVFGLQSQIPEGVKMKLKKFKTFLIIPCIYMPCAFSLMNLLFDTTSPIDGTQLVITFAIIFPLHILSIFGMLYSFYFVAKTIRTVELQREVSFSDFAGDFFLIWFFPVGIWIIQPKLNVMIKAN